MNPRELAPCGFSESFRAGEHERVERILQSLRAAQCSALRVVLSEHDYYAPGGRDWYRWLFGRVAKELELVPCLRYPTESQRPLEPRGALREVRAYTEFVDAVLTEHGRHFTHLELCSPPTVRAGSSPKDAWLLSAEILTATLQAARGGWSIVLGTMIPSSREDSERASTSAFRDAREVGTPGWNGAFDESIGGDASDDADEIDFYWVHALGQRGLLDEVSALSLQGLHRDPSVGRWLLYAAALRRVRDEYGSRASLWLTEGGYPAHGRDEARQVESFVQFLQMPAERHFWARWEDRPQVHDATSPEPIGVVRDDGHPKLLGRLLLQDPPTRGTCLDSWSTPGPTNDQRPVVVIGGAGFIGSNLARSFLEEGHPVVVLDNLSRPGVEKNLAWLRTTFGERVHPLVTDIREDPDLVRHLSGARAVLHMAAQVAVTTSLEAPLEDFEVNALGTLRVLEALRSLGATTPLIFASTNKVYGDLGDLELEATPSGYLPKAPELADAGIDESRPLEFCTPYGCSKGVADQYVLDYARSFGLPTAVLRMSCIYGPRQFGTEDQGWVAYFLLRALRQEAITLYGDGYQVRDILHVEDTVRAYRAVLDAIHQVSGQVFNLGGGPDNAVCLREVLDAIGVLLGRTVVVRRGEPRKGDQLYFVANTSKLERTLGWRARIGWRDGLQSLRSWLESLQESQATATPSALSPRSLMA